MGVPPIRLAEWSSWSSGHATMPSAARTSRPTTSGAVDAAAAGRRCWSAGGVGRVRGSSGCSWTVMATKTTTSRARATAITQPSPAAVGGSGEAEFAGEQAERVAGRAAPRTRRRRWPPAPVAGRAARVTPAIRGACRSETRICPAPQNSTALPSPWPRMCSRLRRDRQRGADGEADHDQPHVLDAGVGEQPFVVALGDDQGRGERQRGERHRQQQVADVGRVEAADGDHPVADQGVDRDREQHAGHQRGDRRGCLAVRVGRASCAAGSCPALAP